VQSVWKLGRSTLKAKNETPCSTISMLNQLRIYGVILPFAALFGTAKFFELPLTE
jgi:hypothetical protein